MISHRTLALIASLAVIPASAALAQTGGSSTADHAPLGHPSGMAQTTSPSGATANTNSAVPGATGRTVVPGSTSTPRAAGAATERDKTGGTIGESGGGGK